MQEHIKWYHIQKCWPLEFDEVSSKKQPKETMKDNNDEEEDMEKEDLFVNTNRIFVSDRSSDSDTSSDGSN